MNMTPVQAQGLGATSHHSRSSDNSARSSHHEGAPIVEVASNSQNPQGPAAIRPLHLRNLATLSGYAALPSTDESGKSVGFSNAVANLHRKTLDLKLFGNDQGELISINRERKWAGFGGNQAFPKFAEGVDTAVKVIASASEEAGRAAQTLLS